MSKKITSFLVLLTALLLTLPSQAQVQNPAFQRAQQKKAGMEMTNKKSLKFNPAAVAPASTQANAAAREERVSLEDEQFLRDKAAKEADRTVGTAILAWDWAAHATPKYAPQSNPVKPVNYRGALASTHKVSPLEGNRLGATSNRAATENAYGIITAPDEGESKHYTRAGTGCYPNSNQIYYTDQTGNVEIVEAADGTVYIKDILSQYTQGTWVKGTKAGNTITIAAGQPLAYNTQYSTTLSLNWGNYDENTENGWNKEAGDITFAIDEEAKTISLVGSNENLYIGVFWDDDNSFGGFGDYETVWTLDENYVPPSTELVELPAGATVETWYADGTGSKAVPTDPKVAFVGSDVYISGLFSDLPNAWIKGTIEGTTATFESLQYLGQFGGTTDIWAIGSNGSAINPTFTFTYDAAAKTLTLDAGQYLIANAASDKVYYLAYISALTLYAETPAPAQIDELPYSNDFSTTDLQKHFTVIDANEDGKTWTFNSNGTVMYSYSSTNAANDWLVSPAIKLTAGKKYHFAIDAKAQGSSFPEKFEVKAAAEATADALAAGATVIEEQTITNTSLKTFENEAFTVATTGYYHIGIHATSDADEYALTVDNFLIEGAPISAPVTLDLTQSGAIDDFGVIDNNGDGYTWAWSASNGIYYNYNGDEDADDYLILPIKLEGGKNYNVVLNAADAGGASYWEKFEVLAGKVGTIEGLTTTVIAETEVKTTDKLDYEGSFSTDEAGTYYIAVHATSLKDMYQLRLYSLTVEAGAEGDAPAAVENLTVNPVEEDVLGAVIAFTAPTKSIAGTDLADGDITKIDILRDGNVINTIEAPAPGSAQSYEDKGADLTIGNHKYQVIPYGASGIGAKSEEITVFLSATLTVPYTADFTVAGTFDAFQTINNNDDSSEWKWTSTMYAYYSYNSTNQADDYLITSPIKLEAGKSYNVTVTAHSYSASYPEKFEVVVGKEATAAGLNQTVIPETTVATATAEDFDGEFSVTEDGTYYVAIHATSDADMWRLTVEKLTIEKGAEPNAPAAPQIEALAGVEGDLSATVKVTAPTKSVDGNALTENVSIDVLADGVVIGTKANVAPGAVVRIFDEPAAAGIHTYQAVASNEAGGQGQKSERVSIFVGEDVLGNVQNFAITDNTANTITFTWDQAAGQNGGYVNIDGIEYTIYTLVVKSNGYWNYLEIVDAVGTVTGETTATINFPVDEGTQGYQYFGVSAKTAAAETDATAAYTWLIVGAPEALPIEEGFAGNSFHYNWNTNGGAYISTDDSDGDGTALKLISEEDNTTIFFQLDKVNLNNAGNPTLLFDVHSGNVNTVRVTGSQNGAATQTLQTINGITDEYQTVKVALNSLKGGRYATVGFEADFVASSYVSNDGADWGDTLIVDNIKIVDLLEYNLNVNVNAPASVKAGEKATVKAVVKNTGENAATGYTVIIKAGDKELLSETVNEELAPFATKEFAAELETSIFDEAESVEVTAEVQYANDLDEDDNEASATIAIKASSAAGPDGVTAEEDAENPGNIIVTWNAPANSTEEITDDVESYDANDNGGLDENVHTGNIGDWTVYDGNEGKWGYGFDGIESNLGNPGSWMVFNPGSVSADLAGSYPAHSGEQYFISAACAQPDDAIEDTDNWLISPALPGLAQPVSFYVRELVTNYGAETYEVLASKTDTNVESFELLESKTAANTEWEEVTVNLPEGTRYFAIRHTSNDVWALLVDDITFTVGGGEVDHYNIYLDEEQVAQVDVNGEEITTSAEAIQRAAAALSYTIQDVAQGEHKVAVTVVYTNGQESSPVAAGANTTITGLVKLLIEGQPVDIYTIDGKLVRSQTTNLNGLSGAYIVNGKKVIFK